MKFLAPRSLRNEKKLSLNLFLDLINVTIHVSQIGFFQFLCNFTHRFLTLRSEFRNNFSFSEKFLAFFQNTIEVTLSCFSRQIKFSVKTDVANSDISFVDFRYQEVECRISIFNWSMSQHTKKHPQIGFSQIFLAFYLCMFFFSIRYQWHRCVTDTHKKTRELNEGECKVI